MSIQPPETPEQIQAALEQVNAAIERREQSSQLQEEAEMLSADFRTFIRHAWPIIEPHRPFMNNWHIDVIADHLQFVTEGRIRKLQVWVPPVSMKSRLVSVLWPAWEWTFSPATRYIGGSYDINLAIELATHSRDLMLSDWYMERWGHQFEFTKLNEMFFKNDKGGHRLSTSPTSKSTGFHGDRVILDDPLKPNDAAAMSKAVLEKTNEWYTSTLGSRGADKGYAEVIVMQRLHENDLAAHALTFSTEEWHVLCIPEVFDSSHPFVYPGDPRTDGDLLWPERRDWKEHKTLEQKLGKRVAAAQLQQRPAAREGAILPRSDFRYYNPAFLDAAENGDVSKLPQFRSIVISWDTSSKDHAKTDFVAGGVWGIHGANRFLLRTFHQRASLSRTKSAMIEMRQWAQTRWPQIPIRTVIEKQSNGTEIAAQLQKEIPGVIAIPVSTDKMLRAEACEPDFNAHNVWVPGSAKADESDYDVKHTPSWVQDVVEECAAFPTGRHDDLVDMVTLALNYCRNRRKSPARTASAARTAARGRRRGLDLYERARHLR